MKALMKDLIRLDCDKPCFWSWLISGRSRLSHKPMDTKQWFHSHSIETSRKSPGPPLLRHSNAVHHYPHLCGSWVALELLGLSICFLLLDIYLLFLLRCIMNLAWCTCINAFPCFCINQGDDDMLTSAPFSVCCFIPLCILLLIPRSQIHLNLNSSF